MIEIECKFRVDHLPNSRSKPGRVEQAYVALDGLAEVRVRRRDGACTLTVKGGTGIQRSEIPLGDADAERLWSLADAASDARLATNGCPPD